MHSCKKGFKVSKNDKSKRCIKILNRSVCSKKGKLYNNKTKKCVTKCKRNEERYSRRDRPSSTKCRHRCKKIQERGKKYCRKPCLKTQKRVNRKDGRGTRCVNRKTKIKIYRKKSKTYRRVRSKVFNRKLYKLKIVKNNYYFIKQ